MDLGERMAQAEAHIANLRQAHRDHEDECLRYRHEAASQLAVISGKVDATHSALTTLTTTLQVWKSAGGWIWTVAIASVGFAAQAFAKWMGWM